MNPPVNAPAIKVVKSVREQVSAGKSTEEVKAFMTDRYGEFVLLKPTFSLGNLALWMAPLLVLLLGSGLLVARLRRRPAEADLTPDEAERLRRLAKDETH